MHNCRARANPADICHACMTGHVTDSDRAEVRVSRVGDKVILEPMETPPIDVAALWAQLDAMGARDFLIEGLPEDAPVAPEDFDLD